VLLGSATTATITYDPPEIQAGNITAPANGSTLVAVQGFHFEGKGNPKKPSRLLSFNETGGLVWEYNISNRTGFWFYDADPLVNRNILTVSTIYENGIGKTLVYELDPETKQRIWKVKFNISDTHDVDLINDDQLLVANMREGTDDRLFIYDLEQEKIVWEWYFSSHYPRSMDGGVPKDNDWTHVNDVDKIGPGTYMASIRNFDQVIVVNRTTGAITHQLGADENYDILQEQHNPAYLETKDGQPVMLVADSENNRVVEYTCLERVDGECQWNRTWELGTGQFNWPRDANRLPNGNTLITDSRNQRVIEVTPTGRIVWEAYAPWAPFSAERVVHGNDGVRSPTMHDLRYHGNYTLNGTAGLTRSTGPGLTFPEWLRTTVVPLPVVGGPARQLADAWQAGAPWIRPVWMAPWALVHLTVSALIVLIWAIAEGIYQHRRILGGVQATVTHVRS